MYKHLYIMANMDKQATLGTLLRSLIDQLDPAVERAYADLGLGYRPRFTPVVRILRESGAVRIKEVAERCGLSHSALSQTVSKMTEEGWVSVSPGEDARERVLQLTMKANQAFPALEEQWSVTAQAAKSISSEIGIPLEEVLLRALQALNKKSFDARLQEAREKSRSAKTS